MADRDHPGIVTAFPSESVITFGGIPNTVQKYQNLCRLYVNKADKSRTISHLYNGGVESFGEHLVSIILAPGNARRQPAGAIACNPPCRRVAPLHRAYHRCRTGHRIRESVTFTAVKSNPSTK